MDRRVSPCTFAELKPDAEAAEAELIKFCWPHLARFRVPKRMPSFGELAKTSTGKIQKFHLRKRLKSASANI